MKSKSLITKLVAFMLCVMMVVGCLPVGVFAAESDWEGDMDEYVYPAGSKENPMMLLEQNNTVENKGTMYYQGYFSGMIMTVSGEGEFSVIYGEKTYDAVDGVVSMPVSSANPRMPVQFAIVGDGTYYVDFDYPAGSMNNPADAKLGNNVAAIEAGNAQGYFFNYIAENDGDLVVTISADTGWTYTINNMTTYEYGDRQWSDSDPVVNPATVTVAAGDEIQIVVNTYDPSDEWNNPAGTITVNLAYAGCAHANTTTTSTATCTEAGVETVVCDDCGETISETEVAALGHDYTGENGACIRCGEYQSDASLKFYSEKADLILGSTIQGSFMTNVKNLSYDSYYIECTMGDKVSQVDVCYSYSNYRYFYYTVFASEMTEEVAVTLFGVKDEVVYQGQSINWTLRDSIMYKLDSWMPSYATNTKNARACDLLANMLNYGTEAQKQFNTDNTNYPTDNLSEEIVALIKTTTPDMGTAPTLDETGMTATVYDMGLSLVEKIDLYVMFKVTSANFSAIEDYSVQVMIEGNTHIIDSSALTVSGSKTRYITAMIDMIESDQMRTEMQVTLMKNGEAASATIVRSADMIVNSKLESYPTLAPVIMNFADCAEVYFNM